MKTIELKFSDSEYSRLVDSICNGHEIPEGTTRELFAEALIKETVIGHELRYRTKALHEQAIKDVGVVDKITLL